MKSVWLFVFLIFGLILAACQPDDVNGLPPTGDPEDVLLTTSWTLEELNGQALIPDSEITLRFEAHNFNGDAGCNTYSGGYETEGNSIRITEIMATEIACPGPMGVMEQEQRYLETLREVSHFQLLNDRLELENEAGEPVLVFSRE
jgi:heat shock protein HslJ